MARKITIMALIAGIVLGASATEGFDLYRQSQASHLFQQRVHCKAVADAYLKENSTSPGLSFVMLKQVDYSPLQNSCVAELETFYPTEQTQIESVRDLLSGQTLYSETFLPNETIPAKVALSELVDAAFYDATGDTRTALKIKKDARAYAASQHLTGATAFYPSPTPSETSAPTSKTSPKAKNDWQTVQPDDWQTVRGGAKPDFIPDAPKGNPWDRPIAPKSGVDKWERYVVRPPLDPATGEPIQINPVTGERIQAPASQHK